MAKSVVRIGKNPYRANATHLLEWNVQVHEEPVTGQAKAMLRAILDDGRVILFALHEDDFEELKHRLTVGATIVHSGGKP